MNARTAVFCGVWLACGLARPVNAQLDSLVSARAPLSPAFALLGVAPIAIERPSTPRAFALALLSATQEFSGLPDSWALELAPFWLKPRPALTYQSYYDASIRQALLQSLSVSVATVRRDDDTNATDLGIGMRAQPLPGKESSKSLALRDSLTQVQRMMTRLNQRRRAAERSGQAEQAAIVGDSIDGLGDIARIYARALQQHQERVGWSLDLAGAWTFAFPGDAFDAGRTAAAGAWATLSYRWEEPQVQFLALARGIHDTRVQDQNLIDLGGRLLTVMDRFVLSLEAVRRIALDVELADGSPGSGTLTFASSGRIVGNAEYRIKQDVLLYAAIGQDHRDPASNRHPLVVRVGLSFEFGDLPLLLPGS